MFTSAQLRGVISPLLTPILADESLDEQAFRRLIEYVIGGGCHALFVLGSTGESVALPAAQRSRSLEVARETAAGRVPILAGIIAQSYQGALANAEMAVACGADAAVATAPYYFTYSQAELTDYFTRLADEIALPLIVYNIPQRTGNPLSVETILALSEHPRILGVKDTSENFMAISRMITLTRGRSDFAILPGTEPLMAPAVLMGGAGAVLGVANLAPHFCVRLYDAARAGDLERVRALQDQMEDLFRLFRHYSRGEVSIGAGLGGLKLAVSLLGIGDERQCFPARRPGDADEMREMLGRWIAEGIIEPPG